MISRHLVLQRSTFKLAVAAVSALTVSVAMVPVTLHAAPPVVSADALETFKPFVGELNDQVYVRSGPSDIYYPTMKLAKSAKVTVVGVKNEWLKIQPPEGAFSYVAKAYVEKTGDGSICRASRNDLNVRAGSQLSGLKTTVQITLQQGDELKILGEQDAYYKVVPPAGVYLYVKKGFVDVVPNEVPVVAPVATDRQREPMASDPIPTGGVQAPATVAAGPVTPIAKPVAAPVTDPRKTVATVIPVTAIKPATEIKPGVETTVENEVTAPTTRPVVAEAGLPTTQPAGYAIAPATQPTEVTADAKFDTLEAAFLDTSNQALEDQPISSLLKKYKELSADPTLPVSMQRLTQTRIATLKFRQQACDQYLVDKKLAADAQAKQVALKVEQEELKQRAAEQQVTVYAALGTLRTSSLQQSGAAMYRLTDPGTSRTLLYVRSNDPKYATMLNQFVGIKGEVNEDSNLSLKILTPTAVEKVDQAKVNVSITAPVEPPSMLPAKGATASIAGN